MSRTSAVCLVVLVIALLYTIFTKPRVGPVIEIKTGQGIQGIISKSRDGRDFYEWLGIPYAEPPVGELRYASPKPARTWEGIRDGSKYGSQCAQIFAFGPYSSFKGSEDCLYLNVHMPKLEKQVSLPVMIWIHGGSYEVGGSDDFRPDHFMDEDVVLVVMNYRLSSFGFLSTADGHIRGNMGLKDQALAIKWVHENIKAFGGDPKRITIFGESAGGSSVHYQTLHAKNKGRFSKAIAQSGSAAVDWAVNTAENARKMTLKFAKSVGCTSSDSSELLSCLRTKSTKELLQGSVYDRENYYAYRPHKDGLNFRPCVEAVDDVEAFIVDHPLDIVISGRALRVPVMTGVVAAEGLFLSMELYKNEESMASFESNFTVNVARVFGIPENSKNIDKLTTEIRNYYMSNLPGQTKEEKFDAYTKMFGDAAFHLHTQEGISQQRKFSPVYAYYYSQRGGPSLTQFMGDASGKWPAALEAGYAIVKAVIRTFLGIKSTDYGVCHADDLPMLFPKILDLLDVPKNDGDPNYLFSKDLVKLWVDFSSDDEELKFRKVKFAPTPATGRVQYFEINESPQVITAPFEDRVSFLKSLGLLKPKLL